MYLYYRDETGIVKAEVNGTIDFLDGQVYFSVEDKEYRISVNQLITIDSKKGDS